MRQVVSIASALGVALLLGSQAVAQQPPPNPPAGGTPEAMPFDIPYGMDGAQVASVAISQGKARTAARYRRPTQVFYNAYESGHPYVATLDPTLVASPGGFPLIEGGKLIGAIGCSGGTGDQDALICKVGADMIK